MSSPIPLETPRPLVISEYTHVKFDIAEKSYALRAEAIPEFVLSLAILADKASLKFSEVVACRSVVLVNPDNALRHEQAVWIDKGPFNSEQFLEMIKFKAGCLSDEWFKHMCNKVEVLRLGK